MAASIDVVTEIMARRDMAGTSGKRETQTERFGMKLTPSLRSELEEFARQHGVDMSDILRDGAAFLMSGKPPESVALLQCAQKGCSDLMGHDAFLLRLPLETQDALSQKAADMGMDAPQLLRQLAHVTAAKEKAEIVEYTLGAGWRSAAQESTGKHNAAKSRKTG